MGAKSMSRHLHPQSNRRSICLCVLSITCTEGLQVENAEMRLDLRRDQLSSQYHIRTKFCGHDLNIRQVGNASPDEPLLTTY